jgi:hypothetical protein
LGDPDQIAELLLGQVEPLAESGNAGSEGLEEGLLVWGQGQTVRVIDNVAHSLTPVLEADTVEMLAMYRPEGGEYLFDTAAISQQLIDTMAYLRKLT